MTIWPSLKGPLSPVQTRSAAALAALPRLDAGSIKALALILGFKGFVFTVAYVAYVFIPLNSGVYGVSLGVYHRPADYGLATRFTTWDSGHYLLLAEEGHGEGGSGRNLFLPPLLPLLIRAMNTLTNNSVVSGLLVANLASLAGTYTFYLFVRRWWDERCALTSLLFLLAFPTAFFMSLIYTESLFLLLSVATFDLLLKGRLGLAALAGFFLPLTRLIGLAVMAPMALAILLRRQGSAPRAQGAGLLPFLRAHSALLYCLALPAAAAVYFLHLELAHGDVLGQYRELDGLYLANLSPANVLDPTVMIRELVRSDLVMHDNTRSILDRAFFLGFLASIPLVKARVSTPLFALYLVTGLTPLLGSFASYMRYVFVAFPLYIAYAQALAERPLIKTGAVAFMVVMQAGFIALHTSSVWVA
jgi:hypothetical protein